MSVPGSTTGGLDDLAAVTREYARYSRSTFGLGSAVTGAWFLGAAWVLTAVSRRAGELLLVLAPLVFMALLVAARAYYQRHGEVVEDEAETVPGLWSRASRRAWVLSGVYLGTVLGIWKQLERPRQGLERLAVAALVATAMLAPSITRGLRDAYAVSGLALFVAWWPGRASDLDKLLVWVVFALAASMLLAGIRQHLRYRRLERRLAALKAKDGR